MMNSSTSSLVYYFNLQYRRLIRALGDNGIYPWLAIPLVLVGFSFISFRLLSGFSFGEYIFGGLALSSISSVADSRRYDFINSISSEKDYKIIRISENLLILLPFIIGYLIFGFVSLSVILLLLGFVFSFINLNVSLPYSMPTPFGRRPFEFARGFRGAVLLVIACYALVPIGLSVDNFNLAVASIAGIGLISGNYFIQPEPRFYVWLHAESVNQFLINKSKTVLFYGLMSMVPIAVMLFIYNPNEIQLIGLVMLSAIAFIEMCMLAKYLAYPTEVNIVAGLAMAGSIFFPPLMILIIPIFYFKALHRLSQYLR